MAEVETVLDLRYNIAALCIVILAEDVVTPEQAFAIIEGKTHCYNDKDTKDMYEMKKQGMYYKNIGKLYGMSESAVYRRIKKYKEKDQFGWQAKKVSQ